jgi:DNA-binding FadR family transcriptional regulator
MAEFRTTSLADQVFEKLENDIIFGVYPRGEILTELKLVEQLGASRTPIREALRRLEQERLIEDAGKGSRVLGITENDLLDIMNIRQRIEGLAAYYATKQDYANALKWVQECTRMVEEVNPDLTTGKTLRARLNLALAQRKANQDLACFRTLRSIQSSIDQMSEADKGRLEQAEQGIYRTTMRELSRTCLLLGDKTTAKAFARKIREDLPEKVR